MYFLLIDMYKCLTSNEMMCKVSIDSCRTHFQLHSLPASAIANKSDS
jgi:hypothetical protein